ncbi:MAG: response regulator [Myxococcales bacterium]|nr:response regulator [Myxococcales bacterium]
MGKVLVVDDDDALRGIVAEAIAEAGFVVDQAENGQVALDKMRAAAPCVVLLDLMMPVMDGWQLVTAMEADPVLASVPVCVISAQDRTPPPARVACLLKKPVTLAELVSTVSTYCTPAG